MKKRTIKGRKLPVKLPSLPDRESGPTRYNEPEPRSAQDRLPRTAFRLGEGKADLRLRVEQLLMRKEAAPSDAWESLGQEARAMLVDLLDDPVVHAQEALLHRVIATVGQLAINRGIAPLGALLTDGDERAITRTYAANALGRIGEPAAIESLAAAVNASDAMLRRQVAIALDRIDRDAALPHLLKLGADKSVAVSEVAVRALQRLRPPGVRVASPKKRTPAARTRKKKTMPEADV